MKAWNSSSFNNGDNLKWLVREVGIPNEMRHQMWLSLIKSKSDNSLDVSVATTNAFEGEQRRARDTIGHNWTQLVRRMGEHKLALSHAAFQFCAVNEIVNFVL